MLTTHWYTCTARADEDYFQLTHVSIHWILSTGYTDPGLSDVWSVLCPSSKATIKSPFILLLLFSKLACEM